MEAKLFCCLRGALSELLPAWSQGPLMSQGRRGERRELESQRSKSLGKVQSCRSSQEFRLKEVESKIIEIRILKIT